MGGLFYCAPGVQIVSDNGDDFLPSAQSPIFLKGCPVSVAIHVDSYYPYHVENLDDLREWRLLILCLAAPYVGGAFHIYFLTLTNINSA